MVAGQFHDEISCRYVRGVPRELISDRDLRFTAHISLMNPQCNLPRPHKRKFLMTHREMTDASFIIYIYVAMSCYTAKKYACTGKGSMGSMHVHNSNRLIDLLRVTETHTLNRHRQESR
jgi:hypothetical protein